MTPDTIAMIPVCFELVLRYQDYLLYFSPPLASNNKSDNLEHVGQ